MHEQQNFRISTDVLRREFLSVLAYRPYVVLLKWTVAIFGTLWKNVTVSGWHIEHVHRNCCVCVCVWLRIYFRKSYVKYKPSLTFSKNLYFYVTYGDILLCWINPAQFRKFVSLSGDQAPSIHTLNTSRRWVVRLTHRPM
jgi:hypothetical protein